jgi:hypothetical protein
MVGAVEHEAGGLVDGQRARAGGGVGDLAGVDGQGFGLKHAGRSMAALKPAARDTPGVDPRPVQAAEQPGMLDLHAAVHHAVQPRGARQRIGLGVGHAQLLPQALRADGDGAGATGSTSAVLAEHVDHVDREGMSSSARSTARPGSCLPGSAG